tara:strand:- start:90 stop:566 length:477 start_codon:yes stop_codon:yes gene_type:complete
MSFTRFNYDEARTFKKMQESTGPGRYLLNTPDVVPKDASVPLYCDDPHIRLQGWGANLRKTNDTNTTIDIDSYLLGYKNFNTFDYKLNPSIETNELKTKNKTAQFTDESRATNPPREYKVVEVDRFNYLYEDPQKHYNIPFANNIDSRELAKKEYLHK